MTSRACRMSEPISEGLLVHTATLTPSGGEDDYGVPIAGTPITLTKIRVSRVRFNPVNTLGESKDDKLTLIFDTVYSQPSGTTFKEGDKVTFMGVDYFVRECSFPSGDSAGVHHYRVALTGAK